MIRILLITLLSMTLAACSVTRRAPTPTLLDLGAPPPAASTAAGSRQAIWMETPLAAPLLDGPGVVWRDGNAGQPQRYAYHRWVAPPAELVDQRVREVLSRQGPVLVRGTMQTLQVQLALDRFEQVFEGGRSHGHVDARVLLLRGGEVIDQLRIETRAPAATDDAAGGAAALRAATDDAVARIDAWLAARPELGSARR